MCKACALRVYAGLDGITLSSFLPGCFRTCWFDPQMAKREAFWWRKLKSNERCNLPKMVEKDPWKRPKQCNTMPLLQYTCSRNPAQMRCARRDGLHPGLIPSERFTHVDLQHSTNPYWNSRFCSTILDIWMFFEDFLGGLEQSWLLLCIIGFDLIIRLHRLYLRTWVVDMRCSFQKSGKVQVLVWVCPNCFVWYVLFLAFSEHRIYE